MWPFSEKKEEVKEIYTPTIGETGKITISEQFKGEVESNKVTFPNELGEAHPFDFKEMEDLYKKFGFFTAVIDKYVDFVVGPGFFIESDDDRAKKIITDFMTDVNFDTVLRSWCKEALVKGNGFLELGGSAKEGVKGLKVLNANYMYVQRDKKGKVKGYNQYKGGFDRFAKDKVINFAPTQIAHVAFNRVGDCAYGQGIGYSALKDIDNLLGNEKDLHYLMKRKANAPIHAKLGKVEGDIRIIPKPADVTAFGQKLESLSNKQEYATDPLVEFKVIDFGNIGDKFSAVLAHDMAKLFYDFQIPPELMGMANIPEGMAKVRADAFQRRIQSIQAEFEKIIEQDIFHRILLANGIDVHVEFEWGTPSSLEVEGRMALISNMVVSPTTSMAMKEILEDELINLLKLDENKWEELKLEAEAEEEERRREEERAQPIVPGQNEDIAKKKFPPKPVKASVLFSDRIRKEKAIIKKKETYEIMNYEYKKDCPHCIESWNNINDIQEWLGFNYKEYLKEIMAILNIDKFEFLTAANAIEEKAGYLSIAQTTKLKEVLETGFKKGSSMKEMAKMVDKKVSPKDLYRMTSEGTIKTGASGLPILSRSADKRAIGIVRTEVTRVANKGAIKYYKENKITKIRWVASLGDRTCAECEALNNQIFEIDGAPEPPLHPMCRCTVTPVVELK